MPTFAPTVTPKTDVQLLAFMRGLPLFENFAEPELAALLKVMAARTFAPNQVIFAEGDRGEACYILTEGQVKVEKTLHDGRPQLLAVIEPGALFGQVALVDGSPRSATCSAKTNVLLIELRKSTFDKLFHTAHPIAYKFQALMASMLAQQLRLANARLARISTAIAQGDDMNSVDAALNVSNATRAVHQWNAKSDGIELDVTDTGHIELDFRPAPSNVGTE